MELIDQHDLHAHTYTTTLYNPQHVTAETLSLWGWCGMQCYRRPLKTKNQKPKTKKRKKNSWTRHGEVALRVNIIEEELTGRLVRASGIIVPREQWVRQCGSGDSPERETGQNTNQHKKYNLTKYRRCWQRNSLGDHAPWETSLQATGSPLLLLLDL